jgi:pimeloyl-ACP methyl ester carboxylesterase
MLAALLIVGTLSLHQCTPNPAFYCGAFERPLDPAGQVSGTISIGFTWYPHRSSGASTGTIVAAEGGPGYPSGGSRNEYRALFDPLLDTNDLLLMDQRGTGRSGAIDCEPLQHAAVMVLKDVTQCGETLAGSADLYGSALAADDLAALLGELGIRNASLYGDSYGTFFVQVFTARHPQFVRSVVLDGAYPAIELDPWYSSTGPTIRNAFDLVCRRSPSCSRLPSTTNNRLALLTRALREPGAPIQPSSLAFIMDTAGLNPIVYRELDAAARAYLDDRDSAPLARLSQETFQNEESSRQTPQTMSQGLFTANSCADNPQAYDMLLPPETRQVAWQRVLQAKEQSEPDLYAPFTIREFLGIPLDYSYVPLCQTWPVASQAHPASEPIAPGTKMPDVPALVLTGDLDTITTPPDGDRAAALFRNSRRIIVHNLGHVTAMDDQNHCASVIVRAFLSAEPFDTSCTTAIPPLRLVPNFAVRVTQVTPAARQRMKRWHERDLREAATAVLAAADALARALAYERSPGAGLRGGTFDITTDGTQLKIVLHGVKWTNDLAVSGTVTYDGSDLVSATLQWPNANLQATWHTRNSPDPVEIIGTIGNTPIDATMPVP